MISVSFFNNKGGVGKTTLLCNVAGYLSLELGKRVCIIDCDPQCNASQYLFHDHELESILDDGNKNIEVIFKGLMEGAGYSETIPFQRSKSFGVDVICGSPKLSMTEDFLSEEWSQISKIRGLTSTLVFKNLLDRLNSYDFVFFDVSPSLGAINRTILLSSDFYISPMSVDIFSLKAFENIGQWVKKWRASWNYAINSPLLDDSESIVKVAKSLTGASFLGYVTQQYMSKRDSSGSSRPVKSYENIISQIDLQIEENFNLAERPSIPYEIGKIPYLFSLAPMSQSSRKPVFSLSSDDGVVGAHFAKVKESKDIFRSVANEIVARCEGN